MQILRHQASISDQTNLTPVRQIKTTFRLQSARKTKNRGSAFSDATSQSALLESEKQHLLSKTRTNEVFSFLTRRIFYSQGTIWQSHSFSLVFFIRLPLCDHPELEKLCLICNQSVGDGIDVFETSYPVLYKIESTPFNLSKLVFDFEHSLRCRSLRVFFCGFCLKSIPIWSSTQV